MENKEVFAKLTKAIVAGESEQLVGLVKQAIDKVDPPEMVEKGMAPGMTEIGGKFGEGQVYLPELLMAAEAWEEAMKIIKPKLIEAGASMKKQGTVVIGTVQVSVQNDFGLIALEVIRRIKQQFSEVNTICGLSNVSFGLPGRAKLNRYFLTMAMAAGLDSAILDPLDSELMDSIKTAEALLGKDRFCQNYIKAFREGKLE
ncbi:MAG: B12-binding domain-containing protein [Planctomycetota bacterium]|nr:MAG: B12-binding domain-containing protein [Planctomycetota bacterium]